MLCLICNEQIFEGDEIQCFNCKEHLHFTCAAFRESVFRKLNKKVKSNWSCSSCKTKKNSDLICKSPSQENNVNEISEETLQ